MTEPKSLSRCDEAKIPVLFRNAAGDWIMLGDNGEKFEIAMNASPLERAMTARLVPSEIDATATIDALRRKGWNAGVKRAGEVAEHYAKLMSSEAAQRAADEIKALEST